MQSHSADDAARIAAEARVLRDTVGVRRLLETAVVRVSGSDAREWLNGQITNDVSRTQHGDATYAFFLNGSGHILADVWTLDRTDSFDLLLSRATIATLLPFLETRIIMEDVAIEPRPELSVMTMQGPLAADVAKAVITANDGTWACNRLGAGGLDIVSSESEIDRLFATAIEVARKRDGMAVSERGWELARVRFGRPQAGVDFDERDLPQETGLKEVAISFDKGCYLGQEAVVMLEHRGRLPKQMVALELVASQGAERDTPLVTNDGTQVGRMTSSVVDPETPGHVPALGFVRRRFLEEQTSMFVNGLDARIVRVIGASPSNQP